MFCHCHADPGIESKCSESRSGRALNAEHAPFRCGSGRFHGHNVRGVALTKSLSDRGWGRELVSATVTRLPAALTKPTSVHSLHSRTPLHDPAGSTQPNTQQTA